MPVEELLVCWYCPREFKTMVDAWGHMDTDHPAEAAEDLRRMDNDVRARRNPNGKAALAFLDQNGLAARTLNVDQVASYAEHHAGGLYVLIGAAADTGKFVKLHDSWGPEDKVVVHEYDPDNPTDDEPVWEFDTGAAALEKFLARIAS